MTETRQLCICHLPSLLIPSRIQVSHSTEGREVFNTRTITKAWAELSSTARDEETLWVNDDRDEEMRGCHLRYEGQSME